MKNLKDFTRALREVKLAEEIIRIEKLDESSQDMYISSLSEDYKRELIQFFEAKIPKPPKAKTPNFVDKMKADLEANKVPEVTKEKNPLDTRQKAKGDADVYPTVERSGKGNLEPPTQRASDSLPGESLRSYIDRITPESVKKSNAEQRAKSEAAAKANIPKPRTPETVSKDLGGFKDVPAGKKTGQTPAEAAKASETSKALGGWGKKAAIGGAALAGAAGVGAVGITAYQQYGKSRADAASGSGSSQAAGSGGNETTIGKSDGADSTSGPKAPTEAPKQEKYKIAKGDTLSDLAKKWNVSVADIAKQNQNIKDLNKISAGAELVRPEKTGNPIYQGGIGTKSNTQSQNLQKPKLKEESEMSNPFIEAFLKLQKSNSSNLFVEAKKAKKLDPVGKEDEDIDNDGDKDKSDSYLHNRRKKIAAAMKEAKDPYGENDGGVHKSPPRPMTDEEKPKLKPSVTKTDAKKKETTVYKQQSEEVDLDESRSSLTPNDHSDAKDMTPEQKKAKHKRYLDIAAEHGKRMKDKSLTDKQRMASSSVHTAAKMAAAEWKNKYMKEEVTFSEAEIEHIAAILEANPVAPTSQDSNTSFGKGGSRTGTLTDETNPKKKIKEEVDYLDEEEVKKKRGRKPGVKVGAYGPRGAKKGDSGEAGAVAGNPAVPHPFHQIRSQRPDADGNYTIHHDTGSGTISAKVSAGHAAKFHNSYLATEKPRDKEALTHNFVQSAFKLEAPKAKAGISLPKMPAPKS